MEEIKQDITEIKKDVKSMGKTLTYIEKDVEYHIKRTDLLEKRLDSLPSSVWAWVAGGVGLVSLIVSIVTNLYKTFGGQ